MGGPGGILDKASSGQRSAGSPHRNRAQEEEGRVGIVRDLGDVPKQDHVDRLGRTVSGNVAPGSFAPSTSITGEVYRFGKPMRPSMTYDPGFSKFPKQKPTPADHANLAVWRLVLEGAEAVRPDLTDGAAAYRHFLEGKGREREFSYERYVRNDRSGQITLRNALLEAQDAANQLWQSDPSKKSFSFTGPAIRCGIKASSPFARLRSIYPYPATENWQKAIGAHNIWLSGTVTVHADAAGQRQPRFEMTVTLHAEDQYNFNPGAADKATNIEDEENGRFVVTNLAHGYRHRATLTRKVRWVGMAPGLSGIKPYDGLRPRQPSNNSRPRNRL